MSGNENTFFLARWQSSLAWQKRSAADLQRSYTQQERSLAEQNSFLAWPKRSLVKPQSSFADLQRSLARQQRSLTKPNSLVNEQKVSLN